MAVVRPRRQGRAAIAARRWLIAAMVIRAALGDVDGRGEKVPALCFLGFFACLTRPPACRPPAARADSLSRPEQQHTLPCVSEADPTARRLPACSACDHRRSELPKIPAMAPRAGQPRSASFR
jgi:hypothetical protein